MSIVFNSLHNTRLLQFSYVLFSKQVNLLYFKNKLATPDNNSRKR